jgi:hypothetical protein
MFTKICTSYIRLITDLIGSPTDILKAHEYELTYECMTDLSKKYDSIDTCNDISFMLRLKEQYGYTREYWLDMDKQWEALYNN